MVDAEKAEKIYEEVKQKFRGHEGEIVAIEPESGECYLGKNTMAAYEKGAKKHPGKMFHFVRVGARTTFFIGAVG